MNRTLKFSAIALLAVVVLWACGGASGPKEVGEKFLMAMAKGDIDGAKLYATKDAQTSLDMMKGTTDDKKANPDKIEIGDVTENGDKAVLAYTENGTSKSLNLTKEDGKWKAEWAKSGGGGLDKLGETLGGAMEGAVEGATNAMKEGLENKQEGE